MGQNGSKNECSNDKKKQSSQRKDKESLEKRQKREEQKKKLKNDLKNKLETFSNEMNKVMSIKMTNIDHILFLNENYDNLILFLTDQLNQKIESKQMTIKITQSLKKLFDINNPDSITSVLLKAKISPQHQTFADRQKMGIFYHLQVFERYSQSNLKMQNEPISRESSQSFVISRESQRYSDDSAIKKQNTVQSNQKENYAKLQSGQIAASNPSQATATSPYINQFNFLDHSSHYQMNKNFQDTHKNDYIIEINEEINKKSNRSSKESKEIQQLSQKKKDLRKFIQNIIQKEHAHFVVIPILKQFQLVMTEAFLINEKLTSFEKGSRNNGNSNLLKSEYEEAYQHLCLQLNLEQADFIKFSFQVMSITLLFLMDSLLKQELNSYLQSYTFGSDTQLYSDIFCGQIIEKLLFSPKNRLLLMSALEVEYRQTNIEKQLDLDLEEDLERLLTPQISEQEKKLKAEQEEELKIQAAIRAISQYSSSRESFIIKNSSKDQGKIPFRAIHEEEEGKGDSLFSKVEPPSTTKIQKESEQKSPQSYLTTKETVSRNDGSPLEIIQNIPKNSSSPSDRIQSSSLCHFPTSHNQQNSSISTSSRKGYTFTDLLDDQLLAYFEEMHALILDYLDYGLIFKKVKKAYKSIVIMKIRFTEYCRNQVEAIKFIGQNENAYPVLKAILKTFLKAHPTRIFDLYKLTQLISLIAEQSIMQTYLGELQLFLFNILKMSEDFDSNLQSQVITPIVRSEIIPKELIEDKDFDNQFQMEFKSNSSLTESELANGSLFHRSELLSNRDTFPTKK